MYAAAASIVAACMDDPKVAGAVQEPLWFSTQETDLGYQFKARSPSAAGYDWYLVSRDRDPQYLGSTRAGEPIAEFTLAKAELPAGEYWLEASLGAEHPGALGPDRDTATADQAEVALLATTDVGVIPAASACPASAETIHINMDNEDNRPASNLSGWVGGTTLDSNKNTNFLFCRVSGTSFASLASFSSSSTNYAVLRLGFDCPPGSVPFSRSFDNEDGGTLNSSSGNISPNTVSDNTNMMFCLFRGDGAVISKLPALGFSYGVFAAPTFSPVAQRGSIFTDDEDDNNANGYNADLSWAAAAQEIVVPGSNTTLFTARAIMCGDKFCSSGESPSSCSADCDVCGNDICRANETAFSCPTDCTVCGDGICSSGESCTSDCDPCAPSLSGLLPPPTCIAAPADGQ
jgi:hypothetical protein